MMCTFCVFLLWAKVMGNFVIWTNQKFDGGWQELYHELHALDRFHTDLKRRQHEEELIITAAAGGPPAAVVVSCGVLPFLPCRKPDFCSRCLWCAFLKISCIHWSTNLGFAFLCGVFLGYVQDSWNFTFGFVSLCIFGFGYIGDSIAFLKTEVKSQEKHVKTLKKRCLWSKVLEEVCYALLPHVGSKAHCDLLHKWWAMLWWCPWTAQTKSSHP